MFEKLTARLLKESAEARGNELPCLPLSRAMLDALNQLKIDAHPVVVRGVVFGRVDSSTTFEKSEMIRIAEAAMHAPRANGFLTSGNGSGKLPYRTIGQAHAGELFDSGSHGSFDEEGKWLGHLVVVASGTLIDPSIGQLNDSSFRINFDPPALTVAVSDAFLAGQEPLIFFNRGMLVAYYAYPNELSFENSRSWTDSGVREQARAIGIRTASYFEGKPTYRLHG